MLTLNGLCSAHGVIVPMQCEYFALEGLTDLVNTIKQVHANLNADLQIIGLLRVMFDPRITLQQQVSDQLKDHFGDKVFDTVIPRNVRLAEAPSYGLPGVVFDPSAKGSQAFVEFAPRDGGPRQAHGGAQGSSQIGLWRLMDKRQAAIKIHSNEPSKVLLLPGWQNSGPATGRAEWERLHGYQRVEQHDWMRPLRGDWSARLEEVVADADAPVVLVAHSLGCILTAWWAAHSRHTAKVRGALLVAPGDVEQADVAALDSRLGTHCAPALPFPAVLVGSRNDPYCSLRARRSAWPRPGAHASWTMATWATSMPNLGLGDWPEGHVLLQDWLPLDERFRI
jgi:predicted alpha/beta hydrolase family esterase